MTKFLVACALLAGIWGCASSELSREQAQLHLRIGTSDLVKGHYPQALSEFLQAEQLDKDNPVIQNNLGLAYFVRKEYELAQEHISRAIQLNPNYSDAKNNLGRIYIELARYDDAIRILTEVTRDLTYVAPEKSFVNLGLAYMKKGEIYKAENSFRKALEANTRFCPAYNYYGQAQFQLQKYSEAIQSFETALKLCNDNYDEAHYFSALSYYKAGQVEKAQARLEEVVQKYPDSEYASKARAMLKIIQ